MASAAGTGRRALGMAAFAFAAQNCALGLTYGSYATVMTPLQEALATSRALVAAGPAVMVLVMALVSPLAGALIDRWSLRGTMLCGAALNMIGYALLSQTTDIRVLLGIFAFILGPGTCMLGILPATVLVSRWFNRDRGKALGIANMPFLIFAFPPIAARIAPAFGPAGLFLTIAAIYALLLPILLLVANAPDPALNEAWGLADEAAGSPRAGGASTAEILRSWQFWVISIGVSALGGIGNAYVTHVVALAAEKGITATSGALMLSAFGAAGVAGAPVLGWLSDRIGPVATLTAEAAALSLLCLGLIVTREFPLLLTLSAMIGLCMGSLLGVYGAALGQLFGVANVARAMGISYVLKIPFLFASAPLAGYAFDRTGSYRLALACTVAIFAMVAAGLAVTARALRGGTR